MTQNKSQSKILFASCAAYCIANIGWWLQPSLIHEVIGRFMVKESDAGLVASAEMAAIVLGSIIFAKLLGRFSLFQMVLIGAPVTLLGAALSIAAQDYSFLVASRSITGLGEGIMLAVSSASLAGFKDPVSAYGRINIAAILFGSAAVFSLPISTRFLNLEHNVFPTIFVAIAFLSLLLPMMPHRTKHGISHHMSSSSTDHDICSRKLLSLAFAVFIVALSSGTMWSLYYLLGEQAGLNVEQIHNTVATAALVSVLGALLAIAVGARFGQFLPLTLGILVLTLAISSISYWHHPLVFRIGAALNIAGTYFLLPYFLGYAATQDPSGRDAAIVASVFLLTGAIGPYLGGFIAEDLGIESMVWIVIIANLVAWRLFLGVNRRQGNRWLSSGVFIY